MTYTITPDESPANPRHWDNLGTIICWGKYEHLSDERPYIEPDEFIRNLHPQAIILPIYAYEHGNIALNTTGFSCPWDSGQIGYIFVHPADARNIMGWQRITKSRRVELEQLLRHEIAIHSSYISGDTWMINILDENGQPYESIGTYFGYDQAEREAQAMIKTF